MGTHTPPMNNAELKLYLEQHLANELHWLLRAATEWHVQEELQLQIDGYHVQVYAMDSAFLHARTLFEFFTKSTCNNYYGCNIYGGISLITSTLYSNRSDGWQNCLHAYMMHAQDRSSPSQLISFGSPLITKDLNKMPIDFAKEIVRLWREFVKLLSYNSNPDIQALSKTAEDILNEAIGSTQNVIKSEYVKKRIIPVVW